MIPFIDFDNDFLDTEALLFLAGASGKAVEDTATGNPLTFATDLAKPLKSLLIPFAPQQQGTGDPSPTNVRNIVPWNGLRLVHLDENLLNINRTSGQDNQGITYTPIKQGNKTVAVKVEGTRTNTNPFFNLNYVNGITNAIPPGTYKIFGGTAEVRIQVFYKDSGGTERIAGYDDGSGATVTVPSDATASWCRLLTWTDNPVDEVIYPIIASADSVITETDISFPSPVYGGTLDAVSGVLADGWNKKTVAEIRPNKKADHIFECYFSDRKYGTGVFSIISDAYKTITSIASTGSTIESLYAQYGDGIYINSGSGTFYICDRNYTEVEAFQTARADVQIVYELATPQEIQLTPAQITALVGNNTIWSDANGEMTAVYFKKA